MLRCHFFTFQRQYQIIFFFFFSAEAFIFHNQLLIIIIKNFIIFLIKTYVPPFQGIWHLPISRQTKAAFVSALWLLTTSSSRVPPPHTPPPPPSSGIWLRCSCSAGTHTQHLVPLGTAAHFYSYIFAGGGKKISLTMGWNQQLGNRGAEFIDWLPPPAYTQILMYKGLQFQAGCAEKRREPGP